MKILRGLKSLFTNVNFFKNDNSDFSITWNAVFCSQNCRPKISGHFYLKSHSSLK